MKTSSNWRAAFFPRRILVTLGCAAACFLTGARVISYLHPTRSTKICRGALTFQQRVTCQRAIEEVYWRHRIWPKECTSPKPSLDTVMSRTQLEKKVKDYLRASVALEDYWQQRTTADQ